MNWEKWSQLLWKEIQKRRLNTKAKEKPAVLERTAFEEFPKFKKWLIKMNRIGGLKKERGQTYKNMLFWEMEKRVLTSNLNCLICDQSEHDG